MTGEKDRGEMSALELDALAWRMEALRLRVEVQRQHEALMRLCSWMERYREWWANR